MTRNEAQALERTDDPRRAEMKTPDEVTAMRRLKALGWGAKRIAADLRDRLHDQHPPRASRSECGRQSG